VDLLIFYHEESQQYGPIKGSRRLRKKGLISSGALVKSDTGELEIF
jgi:hypothetical protein